MRTLKDLERPLNFKNGVVTLKQVEDLIDERIADLEKQLKEAEYNVKYTFHIGQSISNEKVLGLKKAIEVLKEIRG